MWPGMQEKKKENRVNEKLEISCFQIISHAGAARSNYIRAIALAEEGKFDEAQAMISEGEQEYILSHKAHTDIIELEESGKLREASLLIIHAEDQMMSVETFKIMAEKFILLYQKLA